jgi:hypothetical protein
MTKRSHDSITASPYAAPPVRQASHDAEGDGSHEDGEGSSLKKPRSFMATLVCRSTSSPNRELLIVTGLRYLPIEEDTM